MPIYSFNLKVIETCPTIITFSCTSVLGGQSSTLKIPVVLFHLGFYINGLIGIPEFSQLPLKVSEYDRPKFTIFYHHKISWPCL